MLEPAAPAPADRDKRTDAEIAKDIADGLEAILGGES